MKRIISLVMALALVLTAMVVPAVAENQDVRTVINAAGLEDKILADNLIRQGEEIAKKANQMEAEILQIVNSKI